NPEKRAARIAQITLRKAGRERTVDAAEQAIAPPEEGVEQAPVAGGDRPEPAGGVPVLAARAAARHPAARAPAEAVTVKLPGRPVGALDGDKPAEHGIGVAGLPSLSGAANPSASGVVLVFAPRSIGAFQHPDAPPRIDLALGGPFRAALDDEVPLGAVFVHA